MLNVCILDRLIVNCSFKGHNSFQKMHLGVGHYYGKIIYRGAILAIRVYQCVLFVVRQVFVNMLIAYNY